jgi:hypothetical protein
MRAFRRIIAPWAVDVAHSRNSVIFLVKWSEQLRSIERVGCPHFASSGFGFAIYTVAAVARRTFILAL